ncbi:MAG: type II toxin-antitoxin system RelE/ParE family toxin [bacterium]|nr:type II toxin-antitoxin system RelE/ParE family toxin [bacterium]
MVYEVEWSPEALKDIENIAEYIRRDSERYAEIVAKEIIAIGRKIESFPKAGHITPEFNSDLIRERSIYSYRVIYRILDKRVLVAAVIHGKRLLSSVEDRFK